MTNSQWRIQFLWILKVNLIIWVVNGLLSGILVLSGWNINEFLSYRFFSIVTLLETGVAFLIAGAFAFSGSVLPSKAKEYARKSEGRWSMETLKKSEKKANGYIVLAAVLFAESLLVSIIGL